MFRIPRGADHIPKIIELDGRSSSFCLIAQAVIEMSDYAAKRESIVFSRAVEMSEQPDFMKGLMVGKAAARVSN